MSAVWDSNLLAISMLELILNKSPVFERFFCQKKHIVIFRTIVKPKSKELENSRDYQKCVTEMESLG